MIRTLATLSVLALAACGVEPEGVATGDAGELLWEVNPDLDIGALLNIERCRDGIDNDGDGDIDGKDSDCAAGGLWGGGGGFVGGTDEGTGISNPWHPDEGATEGSCGKASWTYEPADGRETFETVLTISQDCEKETLLTEVVFRDGLQIEYFELALGRGDREISLLVQTTDGAGWLAPGPIGDTAFLPEGR